MRAKVSKKGMCFDCLDKIDGISKVAARVSKEHSMVMRVKRLVRHYNLLMNTHISVPTSQK